MTLEQLRDESLRLYVCKSIDDTSDLLSFFADYLLLTIKNLEIATVQSVSDNEARRLINQMILTKVLHIKQLICGVSYQSIQGITLPILIDPTVVAALIRNVYETVGLFNLVYISPKTEDEKTIVYNLWVIAGLKYRQTFDFIANSKESIDKIKNEETQILNLIKEIEDTLLYKSLTEPNTKKIKRKIKDKDYKIAFNYNNIQLLSWQDLTNVMGIKNGSLDKIYTYFSLYSHPSNVSVFQFGSLYKDNDFLGMTNFNLQNLLILLSVFIADYIRLFPKVLSIYEGLPLINQIALNTHNRGFRGEEYSINDSYKILG